MLEGVGVAPTILFQIYMLKHVNYAETVGSALYVETTFISRTLALTSCRTVINFFRPITTILLPGSKRRVQFLSQRYEVLKAAFRTFLPPKSFYMHLTDHQKLIKNIKRKKGHKEIFM